MLKSLLILTALFFGLLSRLAFSSSSRIVEVPAIFWDEWWSTYAGSGGYDSTKHFEKCLEVEVSNLSTTSQTPQVTVLARTIPSAFRFTHDASAVNSVNTLTVVLNYSSTGAHVTVDLVNPVSLSYTNPGIAAASASGFNFCVDYQGPTPAVATVPAAVRWDGGLNFEISVDGPDGAVAAYIKPRNEIVGSFLDMAVLWPLVYSNNQIIPVLAGRPF